MSSISERLARLSPAQQRLFEERLREQKTDGRIAEPIAVVGMSCRFPGAANAADYWRLIAEGRHTTVEIPADRWPVDLFYDPDPDTPGRMAVRWGAFLDQVDQFDALFFGITPREAARMDPQQRLLLEIAWEAMEDAGLVPEALAGSQTGVFVGVGQTDYSKIPAQYDNFLDYVDAHSGTGNALSIAANRLSYIFNLSGPSVAVDTACSSALVAVHLAMQSLRNKECDVALAAAVNLILTPDAMIALSKARMLSLDGCCRPFDAAANGYVRGEGCGVVVLKRLTDAVRAGDHVLAILRHSAVNHVGRTSGITAPSGPAQKAVIRAALAGAGLSSEAVSYIEAHGTGTPLGDPIEVQALGELFRGDGPPCRLTSVKANIGHLEIAAGMAGLIKVILMMQRGQIPGQAQLEELNPHIDLEGTRLSIPREPSTWECSEGPRIAGVSSFGFGGTNAHVIVEAASAPAPAAPPDERPLHVLTITAKTNTALRRRASQFAETLADADAPLSDYCFTANATRGHFGHRAAIVAPGAEGARELLAALAEGRTPAGVVAAQAPAKPRAAVGFLFTGQGSQYVGMGWGLFEREPRFRKVMEECEEIFRSNTGDSLLAAVYAPPESPSLLDETGFTQPALFALEYALANLWRSWGVEPAVLLGHSVGEYAAACLAGVFSLEDGMRLITARGRLMQQLPRGGSMAAVFADAARVEAVLEPYRNQATVAAVNGPENVVVSGEAAAVRAVVDAFEKTGVRTQMLAVSHAFHSPLMEPMLDAFTEVAAAIEYAPPKIPLVSNLTGEVFLDRPPSAEYWRRHVRQPVLFAQGMRRLFEEQVDALLEVGPAPVLLGMGRRCVEGDHVAWLPSLRKGQDDFRVLLGTLAQLYCLGAPVDWRGVEGARPRRRVELPNYPFERIRHWIEPKDESSYRMASGVRGPAVHPLLGAHVPSAMETSIFEARLGTRALAYLADHQVQGSVVVPGAVYLEQGLAAAEQAFGPGLHGLEDVSIQHPMFLDGGANRTVQVTSAAESGGRSRFQVHSTAVGEEASGDPWVLHAGGLLCHETALPQAKPAAVEIASVRERATDRKTREEFYQLMTDRELVYGPAFQVLAEQYRNDRESLTSIALSAEVVADFKNYLIHPALGDACAQTTAGIVPLESDGSYSPYTYVPVSVRRLRRFGDLSRARHVYARRISDDDSPSPEVVEGDVYLTDESGAVLLEIAGFRIQRLSRGGRDGREVDVRNWLYRIAWREAPLVAPQEGQAMPIAERQGTCLIFADSAGTGHALATTLTPRGARCVLVLPGEGFGGPGGESSSERDVYRIDPVRGEDFRRLLEETCGGEHPPCTDLVHLWSLDAPEPDDGGEAALVESRRLSWASGLRLVQEAARSSFRHPPRLWLVSRGAQAVLGGEKVAIAQAPLWGLGRVVLLEHAELRGRLVDLDPAVEPQQQAERLAEEMAADESGAQVAYRGRGRFVARLERAPEAIPAEGEAAGGRLALPASGPFRLRIGSTGSLDSLRAESFTRRRPGPGQVEVAVHAAGLNFSDVLKVLGLYPGITDPVVPLGIECSGVVAAVGEGVKRFRPGDAVMGVAPFSFASHALTAEYALVPKPAHLDDREAATVPITFLTAYYALRWLARLAPGERVLIHAAAGGVGQAAIQIARHVGAEVFATAGSDAKRDFVRALGVEHVMSSRDLSFADEILRVTDRRGVDVVLNSLPGEAIPKSLSLLAAYGRFLEIGKIDIYQNRMIGLSPFQDNLSYFAIDLDRMLRQRPEEIGTLFAEVMGHFESGDYQPLPLTDFPMEEAVGAFRYMAQRKNIGKVVLSLEEQPAGAGEASLPPGAIRADGTYLITGGLGALGLRIAEWLAEAGAQHIVLLARRTPNPAAAAAIAALESHGVTVAAVQGDVTDGSSLRAALAAIPPQFPPLRGIFHAAGMLDDGVLFDMGLDQLDRPMLPKVQGAWHLHEATRDAPLDLFVLFSSVACVFGSPGQGNYAAGNAFLDGLAHYRRSLGLPALAVNWGPWAETGMAAEADRGEGMESRGLALMDPQRCLQILRGLLERDQTQAAVMDVHWEQLLRLSTGEVPPLLAEVAPTAEPAAEDTEVEALRGELQQAAPKEREAMLLAFFAEQLARIMGLDVADLDVHQPLNTMGLDSLMAIELRNTMETRLKVALPMARFMEGPSVTSLATFVAEAMGAEPGVEAVASGAAAAGEYALSYGQRALWFLHRLAPESAAYHIHGALRIEGALDTVALEKTFDALVDRHPILRTTYNVREGRPVQKVHESMAPPLVVEDATEWSEETLWPRFLEAVRQPFDLETEPPLRVRLFRRGPEAWVLLYVVHHIAADFWSLVASVDECRQLYEAARRSEPASLASLPLQYTDFARWQAEMLASEEGERHWQYWQKELGGEFPVLDLPTDRPRPPLKTFQGAQVAHRFDAALTEGLRRLSAQTGATLHTILLAGYQVLLHRYSGQEEILVGTPSSGRTRAEFAPLMGYFVNPVVIRGDLTGDPSFEEFLEQVRRRMHSALDHQDYPFPLLVERLRPHRDPSRSPLFDTMFVTQRTQLGQEDEVKAMFMGEAGTTAENSDLRAEAITLDETTAMFDLTLTVTEADEQVLLSLNFNTDLFDTSTIERMLEHFTVMVGGIIDDSRFRVSELPMLAGSEREQLLGEWNATERELPPVECVHHLVEAQVARTPEAAAVSWAGETLTYQNLDEKANRLASLLWERGIREGDRVGIYLERSAEMVVALLAVLKTGAAYVPLDPSYPAERLEQMASDGDLGAILSQAAQCDHFSPPETEVICLDEIAAEVAAQPATPPPSRVGGADLAYLIYTSGSTGTPKGVMIPHRAVVNFLLSFAQEPGLGAGETILASTTISFDIAVLELFLPLSVGARALIVSNGDLQDGAALADILKKEGVAMVQGTPSTFRMLFLSGWRPHGGLKLLCGGEPMDGDLAERLLAGDSKLWNVYGPTETTVWSTREEVTPADGLAGKGVVSIGRPIANTQVYILDSKGHPVPAGVPGELCIGGTGLARGYWKRPELTADRFISNPFDGKQGSRLYRTGDLARWRRDGRLEFVGRRDHQVKLRGFRVELGEVEAALAAVPGVVQAAAVVRKDHGDQAHLVAYLVLDDRGALNPTDLRRSLARRLPDYMIPSAFVFLDTIPRSPAGKVDRNRLPVPDRSQLATTAEYLPPRTPLEAKIAAIWSEVLGVEKVGVRDDFFELGGHSLAAVALISRLAGELDCQVPLSAMVQESTVEHLASLIEAGRATTAWSPLVPLQPQGEGPPLFFVHPTGGNILCYQALARSLGPRQASFALEARGLQGDLEPHCNREEMLAEYAAAIRTVQPQGPFYLAGWSLGGILAYELAGTLRKQQEEVGLVVMFDTYAPTVLQVDCDDEVMILGEFLEACRQFLGVAAEADRATLESLDSSSRLEYVAECLRRAGGMPVSVEPATLRRFVAVAKANLRLATGVTPENHDTNVLLFRAADREGSALEPPDRGWKGMLGAGLVVGDAPGNHWTMLAPDNADFLAERLREAIAGMCRQTD